MKRGAPPERELCERGATEGGVPSTKDGWKRAANEGMERRRRALAIDALINQLFLENVS